MRSEMLAEPAPDIVQSIEIRADLDHVWREITAVARRQRAMMDTVLETSFKVGDPVFYRTPDRSRVFIVGRVVEVDPPRRFAYTFRLTMRDDPTTLLWWTLEPSASGVRVTVTQSGLPAAIKGREKVSSTWADILVDLKVLMETGQVRTRTKLTYVLMRLFMPLLPKGTRPEHAHPEPIDQITITA